MSEHRYKGTPVTPLSSAPRQVPAGMRLEQRWVDADGAETRRRPKPKPGRPLPHIVRRLEPPF